MAIAYFCGRTIAQMFISAEETALLDSIRQFLTINGIFYFPLAIILVYRNSLQGLGFSNSAMLAGVFELVARSAVACCWWARSLHRRVLCQSRGLDRGRLPALAHVRQEDPCAFALAGRARALESMQAEYEAKLHA